MNGQMNIYVGPDNVATVSYQINLREGTFFGFNNTGTYPFYIDVFTNGDVYF
jgi:hypothetical protein